MNLLRRLGNPVKSEAAAFRWLVVCVALIALITAVTLLVRAIA